MEISNAGRIVSQDKSVRGGALVFAGTRVRVKTLVDHLKRGYALDEFLQDFPSVTREQAEAFLDQSQTWARASLQENRADARTA